MASASLSKGKKGQLVAGAPKAVKDRSLVSAYGARVLQAETTTSPTVVCGGWTRTAGRAADVAAPEKDCTRRPRRILPGASAARRGRWAHGAGTQLEDMCPWPIIH